MLDMFVHTAHIWVEEQQTGHVVCAWCNACKGGCTYAPRPEKPKEPVGTPPEHPLD